MQPQGGAHQVVNADAVPALHDGQEGDEGGNDPAAADHQSHSHRCHLVPVDQGLTADGVVPAQTTRGEGVKNNENKIQLKLPGSLNCLFILSSRDHRR